MLCRVRLMDDFDLIDQLDLGPDTMNVTCACFEEHLRGHRGAIKSTLMDPSILAGLGNTYTDEVLIQARIHPLTPTDVLSERERHALYRMMRCCARPSTSIPKPLDCHAPISSRTAAAARVVRGATALSVATKSPAAPPTFAQRAE